MSHGEPGDPASADLATFMLPLPQRHAEAVLRLCGPLPTSGIPHFVRCLKPNNRLAVAHADPALVRRQLAGACTLSVVALRHSGLPYRTTYADFYARFMLLVRQGGWAGRS